MPTKPLPEAARSLGAGPSSAGRAGVGAIGTSGPAFVVAFAG